jgi:phosphatidylglycerol---prolipoprotein diacylglyceryl transferase
MNPFSAILGIGASFGLLRIIQTAQASSRLRWLISALITLVGALLEARAGFVLLYFSYFKVHPQEIAQIAQGGLAWPGALAGTLLFALISLLIMRLPVLAGFDQLSRMLLPISVALWLGCWQAGIAYGSPLPANTWWGMLITDDAGLTALRVPVQPVAVISLILLLGLSEWLMRRVQRPGLKFTIIISVLSIHTLLFSLMKADPMQRFLNFRVDTWAAGFYLAGSLLFTLILLVSKPKMKQTELIKTE